MIRVEVINQSQIAAEYTGLQTAWFNYSHGEAKAGESRDPILLSQTQFRANSPIIAERTILDHRRRYFQDGRMNKFFVSPEGALQVNTNQLEPFDSDQITALAQSLSNDWAITVNMTQEYDYGRSLGRIDAQKRRLDELRMSRVPKIIIEAEEERISKMTPEYPIGHRRWMINYPLSRQIGIQIVLNCLTSGEMQIASPQLDLPKFPGFEGKKTPLVLVNFEPRGIPDFYQGDVVEIIHAINSHTLGELGNDVRVLSQTLNLFASEYGRVTEAVMRILDPEAANLDLEPIQLGSALDRGYLI